jgi:hypothetical protein
MKHVKIINPSDNNNNNCVYPMAARAEHRNDAEGRARAPVKRIKI